MGYDAGHARVYIFSSAEQQYSLKSGVTVHLVSFSRCSLQKSLLTLLGQQFRHPVAFPEHPSAQDEERHPFSFLLSVSVCLSSCGFILTGL